jgi:hypothetical protein
MRALVITIFVVVLLTVLRAELLSALQPITADLVRTLDVPYLSNEPTSVADVLRAPYEYDSAPP